jgi:hypothetical protein
MSRPAAIGSLGSEFNEFLYAPIGDDANGNRLSVLSALGRCDVDPWETAAVLARLPRNAAVGKLVTLLSVDSDAEAPHPDLEVMATRVIALLPMGRGGGDADVRRSSLRPALTQGYFLLAYILTCLIFIVLLQLAQAFESTTNPTKDGRPAVSSGAALPTAKPEKSD